MSSESVSVIGDVVAEIARTALAESSATGGRPGLRISNFDEDEVVAIVTALEGFQIPGRREPVTIKVGTRRKIEGLGDEFVLAEDETLTQWRNKQVAGLVVVDLDTQGDEEGLKSSLHSIDDRSVLASVRSDGGDGRAALVVRSVWRSYGRDGEPPTRLATDLDTVRNAFSDEEAPSLRRWTSFLVEVCSALRDVELLTPELVDRAVGQGLPALGLFPDDVLFTSERTARGRLSKNICVSDLRQPTGATIGEDELQNLVAMTEFDPFVLAERGIDDVARLRRLMHAVVENADEQARRHIPLEVWLELFERRTQRMGLGAQVREQLKAESGDRLAEFEELDVEAGLDHNEQSAAEALVTAEPPEGSIALVDVLASSLRRRVEKLAFPDARVAADPLRALLHGLHVLDDDSDGEGAEAKLLLEGSIGTGGSWSRWLFWFLYGPTLQRVVEETAEGRRPLTIDPDLCVVTRPPLPPDDEEFDPAEAWAPLRLTVDVDGRGRRRFRWDPLGNAGVIGFASLVHGTGPPAGAHLAVDLEAWCTQRFDPRGWDEAPRTDPPPGPLARRLRDLRSASLKSLRGGLDHEVVSDYVERWVDLAAEARAELVPTNAPHPELAELVLTDVVELADDKLAMLAVHPLRLRWVARHLARTSELIVKALTEGLRLNQENSELFVEWLDRVSPHGSPPFVVGAEDTVAMSVREFGWHEEYASIRKSGREEQDWSASVDDAAIDEMAGVVSSYLDTYPYKADGLVLLLLARDGATRIPLRLVQRVRGRTPGVRIELHLYTPRSGHHDVVRAFEDAFADDESSQDRLFPDVQLMLRSWDGQSAPDLQGLGDRVDIALAPALFGARTTLKNQTKSSSAGIAGSYEPWLHRATHDFSERTQNVVRVLLPQQQEPVLETWSTLCVRHDGHSAVAPQQETNTDYFSLQVRFDSQQSLFEELHSVAHWVVTLDGFVGRDQIDALQNAPDVILVRTGVGKNEAYNLVVSSATGRRFVVKRLVRKFQYDLQLVDAPPVAEVADRFYEIGRHVVPGTVLRALGLGHAAHEIVGLVVSRYEVARRFPVDVGRSGLEVWIGFDEHLDWFGRGQRMRADLGRFTFFVDEGGRVTLEVLIVESKFRRREDVGMAQQQLDRTTDLCRGAFEAGPRSADDSEFWWQELAAALEQMSRKTLPPSDLPSYQVFGPRREGLEEVVNQAVLGGDVALEQLEGVAVAIAVDVDDPAPPIGSLGRHRLLRLHGPEFQRVIRDLVAHRDPAPVESSGVSTAEPSDECDPGPSQPSWTDMTPTSDTGEVVAGEPVDEGPVSEMVLGLGDAKLRQRYETLLDTFRQHSVDVEAPGSERWTEGPGFYVLRVRARPGVTADRVVNRVNEIQLALKLPAGNRIRTSLDRGMIVFEIPKTPDERYPVLTSAIWPEAPVDPARLVVPLGEDLAGDVVSLDLSSPDSPHLLVAGTTGSGKSVALETLLRAICRYPAESAHLHLVDPKGTELLDFADDPHTVGEIGMDAVDALEILRESVVEMQHRYDLMRSVRARSIAEYNAAVEADARLPWKVLVLDEYADLTSDPEDKTLIEQSLKRLTQKARAAGIHVIVATQRPSADVVSSTIRSNFPAQLALRVKTATDSRIVMDEPGAETLAGQGDAFLRTARGLTRLQVAYSG